MNATPIQNALQVVEAARLPDGELYFITPCSGYDVYAKLPNAAEYEGRQYGLTGWNSDTCVAYYKAGKKFARGC